jgi:hypothetical protein
MFKDFKYDWPIHLFFGSLVALELLFLYFHLKNRS